MTESYVTYCVVDSYRPVPEGIVGLHGGAVTNLPYQEIGVVVSALPRPLGDIVAGAVTHEAVVERLMETHTVLPMRFPTVFKGRDAILDMANSRYDIFRDCLRRLRGRVEFGVKALWPVTTVETKGRDTLGMSGTGYMQERYRLHKCRRTLRARAVRFGRALDASLSERAAAKKVRNLVTDALAFDGVYLVDKAEEDSFRRAFADVRKEDPGFKYLLSGPWPPYSFVEAFE
jgi:hypothetical protein